MLENKNIKVFDNIIPFQLREKMYAKGMNSFFRLGWKDNELLEDVKPNLYSQWSYEDLGEFPFLSYVQKCIAQTKWFNSTILEKIIINLVISEDVHYLHSHANAQVVVYYMNLQWEDGWYGETLFHDLNNLDNIIFTSTFKPGRLILFDGSIPHAIRPQSIKGPKYRITLTLIYTNKN